MESSSWFVPILPGKVEAWKEFTKESEARMPEHARSRRRAGITREVVSLVETPEGGFTSVFLEAENVPRAMQIIRESTDPYDKWFFEKIEEMHGADQANSEAPLPKVYVDYREEQVSKPGEKVEEVRIDTRS